MTMNLDTTSIHMLKAAVRRELERIKNKGGDMEEGYTAVFEGIMKELNK